jgi:hypothetical protein
MYCSPQNYLHPIAAQCGGHVILVARGLTYEWERMIVIKELMHMLDGDKHATDSGAKFETVLTELMLGGSADRTPETDAEIRAAWRAIGLICPEKIRKQYKATRCPTGADDPEIAKALKVPVSYVGLMFGANFENRLADVAD